MKIKIPDGVKHNIEYFLNKVEFKGLQEVNAVMGILAFIHSPTSDTYEVQDTLVQNIVNFMNRASYKGTQEVLAVDEILNCVTIPVEEIKAVSVNDK